MMKRICPACGSKSNTFVFENRFEIPSQGAFYESYNVVECDCGMVYADDLPSQEEFDAYYQAQSKKASRFPVNRYKEPDWYIKVHEYTSNWLNRHISLNGRKVLDAGCFTGDLMRQMEKFGATCFGYDPSTTGILVSKSLGLSVSLASSFCSSDFFGEKFELITLCHVIEHIQDHQSFFADLDYALTSDSQIYIEVPDLENFRLSNDTELMIDKREPMLQFNSEHINFFSKQSLARMMDRLGYQTIEIAQVNDGLSVLAGLFKKKTPGKTFCYSYLEQCKRAYQKIDEILFELKDSPVYIWGVGGHTQRTLYHSNMKTLNVVAFIDNNDSYRDVTLLGRPIITPSEIYNDFPIVISSIMYMDDIADQIRKMGLRNKIIKLY